MDAVTSFDFSILNFIQEHFRCDFLDGVCRFLGSVGNMGLIWIAFAVILLFFKKTRAAGMIALLAMGLGYLLGDIVIKPIVQRPRPFTYDSGLNMFWGVDLISKKPGNYSFPSGHSAAAWAFATTLLVKRRTLGLIAVLPAVLMMLSRLYLYVHFPTDVLCGALLGAASAFVMMLIFKKTGLEAKIMKK